MSNKPHVVFIQYGDYHEAYERLKGGGIENYTSQRYSVDFVGGLVEKMQVTVIALPPECHDLVLENGVRAIGMGWSRRRNIKNLIRTLENLRPSHLIVNTPLVPALIWGLFRAKRVLPNFADSFSSHSVRGRIKEKFLAGLLNLSKFEFVTNHNYPASINLVEIGVKPRKVLAWDWPSHVTPYANKPKEAPNALLGFSLFYVGSVLESKGVGDLIEAVAILRSRKLLVNLTVAGTGDIDQMRNHANKFGVLEFVDFKGRISNTDVQSFMRVHDAVIVPSRSSYPEGLPMAIYEGLCSRTPLIVSSHPMFIRSLKGQEGIMMFEEGSSKSLAESIYKLMHDSEHYEKISKFSAITWESIQVPLKTGELLSLWLSGTSKDLNVLSSYSIGNNFFEVTSSSR